MDDKKSRILYILRCLQEKTDEQHPISTKQIQDYLETQGIKAHRQTIPRDIQALIDYGVDIVEVKSTQNLYFIGDRQFELHELKYLIDAVQASKFFTVKQSKSLIGKLLNLASPYQSADLTLGLYFDRKAKPKNETASLTADLMLTAINTKKQVRFMYYEYGPDKKKIYKHGRRVYVFSPWAFILNSESYYIIGYSENHGKAVKFRVDRIASPKLTDIPAVPAPKDFDVAKYAQAIFQMYDGPMLDVVLKCENTLMKTIIDRFGEDVHTEIADTGHFYAKVRVSASKTFYGWVFASDGAIRITAPDEAVKAYHIMLDKAK